MKRRVYRKHPNSSKFSKNTAFIKTGLPCKTFTWKNYEPQCQSLVLCNVRLNTEPSQVVQTI